MQIYDTFQQFWNELSSQTLNSHQFHDWQVVQVLHTSDQEYAVQKATVQDELGFQPLSITLANTLTQQSKQVLIKDVTDSIANDFRTYARHQYVDDLPQCFGSFRPDTFEAFAEYDNWELFYTTWLEREGKLVVNQNVPLLFDHTPKVEYWTRKQTGQPVLPYQRLLVTTFFASKNQFFDFFIKNVDDAEMSRIMLLMQSRIGLNVETLFAAPDKVARV